MSPARLRRDLRPLAATLNKLLSVLPKGQAQPRKVRRVSTHLGSYFKAWRERRGLSPQALAGLAGYRNVNRGARRILDLEVTGASSADLVSKLAKVLGVSTRVVAQLAQRDLDAARAAFERWLAEPVESRFFVLPLAAVSVEQSLPPPVLSCREQAAEWASEAAKSQGLRAVLVWNRRWAFWVDAQGRGHWVEATLERPWVGPLQELKGRHVALRFAPESGR